MFGRKEIKEISLFCRGMEEELNLRTNSMIVHYGQALACSDVVKLAYEELREELNKLKWENHKIA